MKRFLVFWLAAGLSACLSAASLTFDALSADGRIRYLVPAGAPDEVTVAARYRLEGEAEWRPAAVNKYRSATALTVLRWRAPLAAEQKAGMVTEWLAAGRERTLVWRTARQLPAGKAGKGEFEVVVSAAGQDKPLARYEIPFAYDLRGVVLLDRFQGNPSVFPQSAFSPDGKAPGWREAEDGLEVVEKPALQQALMWDHQLSGYYALHVAVPRAYHGEIELELTGDGFTRRFSGLDGNEDFWKIAKLDNTQLVIRQPNRTLLKINDGLRARLAYVKCVPVPKAVAERLLAASPADKMVAGYFEPYSWAFRDDVHRESKFLEAALAYAEAGVTLVDMQVGRAGSKTMYPSRIEEPLFGTTKGDAPPGSRVMPVSDGTGRMVMQCNIIAAMKRASRVVDGQSLHINFGAANNYRGGILEGRASRRQPDLFRDRFYLDYSKPEARAYLLSLYREVLELGAENLSIDFCRYPHGVTEPEGLNIFLRDLRRLADGYAKDGRRPKILINFPVPGNKGVAWKNGKFQPEMWVKERLVDYLVPRDFSGSPFFDATAYVAMAKGTGIKVLPCLYGLSGGQPFPAEALRRIQQFYRQGADGVYIYQSDAHIVGSMTGLRDFDADTLRKFTHAAEVDAAVAADERELEDYSAEVYLHYPEPYQSARVLLRIEGIRPEKVEFFVNGKLVSTRTAWPWVMGEPGFENHYTFLGAGQTLKVAVHVGGRVHVREFKEFRVLRSTAF